MIAPFARRKQRFGALPRGFAEFVEAPDRK
jgi:hypothetical protein